MKIKELEQASGLPRASIRFYEKEGLLTPTREENGYRDYSQEDLETLKKIVLLRALDVSLKDIQALQRGEAALQAVMEAQVGALEEKQRALEASLRICRELRDARVSYGDLPAQKYLDAFRASPRAAQEEVARTDSLPRVQAPVRRFFARELDLFLLRTIWLSFLALVCSVGTRAHQRGFLLLADIAVPLLLLLLLEPLCLRLWGTTPGKWLLGLGVTDPEGGRLSYSAGLDRTGRVIVRGLGLCLPVLQLVRLWKSCRACDDGEALSWEEDSSLTLRDEKPWRSAACAAAFLLVFSLAVLALLLGGAPRYKGNLTVAQFSANFNRLARYYDCTFTVSGAGAVLGSDGLWTRDPADDGIPYLDLGDTGSAPIFAYRTGENGLEEISFRYESIGPVPSACRDQMAVAALAFACAQKGFGPLSRARQELLSAIDSHPFQSFTYAREGVELTSTVDCEGYRLVGGRVLFPEEEGERYYTQEFCLRRTG